MSATDLVFTGAYFLANKNVDVVIGGLDCGTFLAVEAGNGQTTVTVPIASIPAPGGDVGVYLQSIDVGPWDKNTYGDDTTEITLQIDGGGRATVYVPVLIGFSFYSAGQRLRPATENETKSQEGPSTGKRRKVWAYGVLVTHTKGLYLGTNVTNQDPAPLLDNGGNALPGNVLFDGVVYNEITEDDSFEGQLMWTIPRPYPCIINSLNGFVDTKDR